MAAAQRDLGALGAVCVTQVQPLLVERQRGAAGQGDRFPGRCRHGARQQEWNQGQAAHQNTLAFRPSL
jgi:hypothetical protein